MVRAVERTATGSAAETASSGVGFGLLGAIAGGVVATALFAGGGALLAAGAVDLAVYLGTLSLAGEATTVAGLASGFVGTIGAIGGVVTGIFSGGIMAGAAIGAGGGALAGIAGKSKQIKAEANEAHKLHHGHALQVQQQMAEVRAQAAEEYTKMGYAQGMQDGQVAVMQHLQQAAMEQQAQMAQAEPEQGQASFADKILSERGGSKANTHAEQALASKEHAAGQELGA